MQTTKKLDENMYYNSAKATNIASKTNCYMAASGDEHIIVCSITYAPQRMTEQRQRAKNVERQM